ncbi:MAG: T9SS type A sorting domain-containing protein [Saprospiraceae bacterium]|nr:T9SS type A sorting domain-containing protein [Saprospiraceae bacterium]
MTGYTELTISNSDAFLARFDNDGNQLWMNTVGRGSHTDVGQGLAPTEDGGFIVIGYNSIFGILGNDVTFIKAGADGSVYTNHLIGKIAIANDCIFQPSETGLNDWIVRAASDDKTFFGTTDANGVYDITVAPGSYVVSVLPKNQYWSTCIPAFNAIFLAEYDTILYCNFPIKPIVDCPLLEVDISAPVAQNCSNIAYTVSYCNTGTTASTNTSVNVILDNGLTFVGASIPVASQNDSLLVFDLGLVGLDECGSFFITASSDCSGLPTEAYIVSAHIFPDAICLPADPNWDMASVSVNGYCDVDSIRFEIINDGLGDMQQPQGFIVIEDNVMLMTTPEPFQLLAGQDTTFTLPANGPTYRLIAEQTPGHPGNSYPTVAVEGCTTTGTYSTGFVTELQEDENDPFLAVDAQENISSFTDYIILRGYPKGYQQNGENLIPANTDIEYHVYFQNVGMDTITRLVVRDTLSPFLDLGTVTAGASSHPYDFEVYSDGVLKFTFEELALLPGGGAASTGFVKFKVSQKPDNSEGTHIPNSATVFVGYDMPFQTATYTHVIGGDSLLDFIVISDVNTPEIPGVEVTAYPNPFVSAIEFEAKELQCKTLTINVFDINGRLVRQEKAPGNHLRLQRNGMPSGTYAFQLEADGRLIHTGKIIVR